MKKILRKNYSSLMGAVAILLLIGITACAKKVDEHFDIAFTKPPALESLYDIVQNRCNDPFNSYMCTRRFDYDKNITIDQLKMTYRLACYIKIEKADFIPGPFILQSCSGDKTKVYGDGYLDTVFEPGKEIYSTFYYNIDELKQKGFISSDESNQKDLCLFIYRPYMGNFTTQTKYTSNKLVITAEEINRLMDEYRQLKGGEGE